MVEDRLSVFAEFLEETDIEGSTDLILDYEQSEVHFRLGNHPTLEVLTGEWYKEPLDHVNIFYGYEHSNSNIVDLNPKYKNLLDRIRNRKEQKDDIIILGLDAKLIPFVREKFYDLGTDLIRGKTSTFHRMNLELGGDYWREIAASQVIHEPQLDISQIRDRYGTGVADEFWKLRKQGHAPSDVTLVVLDDIGTAAVYVNDQYLDMTNS